MQILLISYVTRLQIQIHGFRNTMLNHLTTSAVVTIQTHLFEMQSFRTRSYAAGPLLANRKRNSFPQAIGYKKKHRTLYVTY